MLADIGPPAFLARLHGAGAEIVLPKDAPVGLAIGLGGLGISLDRSRAALCGLARGGEAPALLERLDGAPPMQPARRVTDPVAAFYVEDILRGAPPPPNALSGRIAFKTGTSYGFRDALAIGFDKRDDHRRLGRPPRQRADAGPGRPRDRGADPVRRVRAARARDRAQGGRRKGVLRVAVPPICRRRCATCAGRAEDDRRDGARGAENRLSARWRANVDLDGGAEPLTLKALGGAMPLTWFVNGAPVGGRRFAPAVALEAGRRGFCPRPRDRRQGRDGCGDDPHPVIHRISGRLSARARFPKRVSSASKASSTVPVGP